MPDAVPSSEFELPIFVSSTHYGLQDLRAALGQYLRDLRCKPYLSSEDGFPDQTPDVEPWEYCLEVLDTCYFIVLVVDGRYGTPLSWPHYEALLGKDKLSPTHGEYLYAHRRKKRLLVFVREEVLTYYEQYRLLAKELGGDVNKVRAALPLPDRIEFAVLPFLHQVKTTDPIPWIVGFRDVTDIQRQIHHKLINELAVIARFKARQVEAVVQVFTEVLESLPSQQREDLLIRVGATQALVDQLGAQVAALDQARKRVGDLEKYLAEAADKLEHAERGKEERKFWAQEAARSAAEVQKLSEEIAELKRANFVTVYDTAHGSWITDDTISMRTDNIEWTGNIAFVQPKECSECSSGDPTPRDDEGFEHFKSFRICTTCRKAYCWKCWPPEFRTFNASCKKCIVTA